MESLDTIIIPVSYFTLGGVDDYGEMEWRKYYYVRFYGLTLPFPYGDLGKMHSMIMLSGLRPSMDAIKNYFLFPDSLNTCDRNGWGHGYPVIRKKNFAEEGRNAAARHETNDAPSFNTNVARLNRICALAASRRKNVVLISTPSRPEYRVHLDPKKVARDRNVVRQLLGRYPNVAFLNYGEDGRFHQDDFYDADHLNCRGAAKFAKILDRALVEGDRSPKK